MQGRGWEAVHCQAQGRYFPQRSCVQRQPQPNSPGQGQFAAKSDVMGEKLKPLSVLMLRWVKVQPRGNQPARLLNSLRTGVTEDKEKRSIQDTTGMRASEDGASACQGIAFPRGHWHLMSVPAWARTCGWEPSPLQAPSCAGKAPGFSETSPLNRDRIQPGGEPLEPRPWVLPTCQQLL